MIVLILLLSLVLRLVNLNQSFWLDEAAQLIESSRPLAEQFQLTSDFHPPLYHLLDKVRGSIINLPFKDSSFDAVCCVDTLEHLPKEKRRKAIQEMLRVAVKKVLIAVPCSKLSLEQDIQLDILYRNKHHQSYLFLQEQIEYELPTKNEIIRSINLASTKLNKKIEIKTSGNENLALRKFLMKGWISKGIVSQVFFRKVMLLFIPFMATLNKKPFYRQIFIVDLK